VNLILIKVKTFYSYKRKAVQNTIKFFSYISESNLHRTVRCSCGGR